MFAKVRRYLSDPYYSFGYDLIKKHPTWMSDKYYISVLWKMLMGYSLDWKNPRTFNEKLQWLKLNDHNPLYSTLVDKYRVKQWVQDRIGEEYVIPSLREYGAVNEINLEELPNQFVLKCNHDSGSVIICKDKASFDLERAKNKLNKCLSHNFYWDAREWSYKKVKPLVFAERFMEDSSYPDLLTYKFLCFDGEPKIMYVTVKNENVFEDYYDMDYHPLDIHRRWPNCEQRLAKPRTFEEMKRVARVLSTGLKHVRIDLYEVNGQVYFSEYTFYDWGGLIDLTPKEWNFKLGDLIQL